MPFGYTGTASTVTPTSTLWRGWNDAQVTVVRQGDWREGTTSRVWNNWNITTSTVGAATAGQTITVTGNPGDVFHLWITSGTCATNYEMHRLGFPGATDIIHTNDLATANVFTAWADSDAHRGRIHVEPRVQAEVDEAWRQRRREEEAAAEARRRETQEAKERAMALLRSCLSPEQLRDLAANNYFFVRARSGNLYRIDKGSHGNVKRIDPETGVWIESLCVSPSGVPEGDAMLMQKLLIETAEEELRRVANITRRNGGMDYSQGGPITGERLAQIIPFPAERARMAA